MNQPQYMQGVAGDYSGYSAYGSSGYGNVSAGPFVTQAPTYADAQGSAYLPQFGHATDDQPENRVKKTILWLGSSAGGILGAFHGYKRHGGSIGWAIGWSILGGLFWPITLPVMFAQGLGKEKFKTTVVANAKRKRRRK